MKGINLGKINTMTVVKSVDFGMYLDGGDEGEILLPTRYVPEGCKPGDVLDVLYISTRMSALLPLRLRQRQWWVSSHISKWHG